ncbi:MAG TPA: hypothetical protein VFE47_20125 [Tepidisphaeraceae bacterium]|jgi:hypothetical protein|nr:hypothetical protein [Tepidisphaeraceae bacterium]
MMVIAKHQTPSPRIDPAAFFKKLGLFVADERPIMEPWRAANAAWRAQRRAQIAALGQRTDAHIRRYSRAKKSPAGSSPPQMGRRRAVWCVELRRRFRSLTEAAKFVDKSPANISQSLKRGVRCGKYHWETFDPQKHDEGHARQGA